MKADLDVLLRKVVRDSIRGISELQRDPGETPMADCWYYHSKRGHSVCMAFFEHIQKRADSPSQSSSTERRHQAHFWDHIRRGTPRHGGPFEDCIASSSKR